MESQTFFNARIHMRLICPDVSAKIVDKSCELIWPAIIVSALRILCVLHLLRF